MPPSGAPPATPSGVGVTAVTASCTACHGMYPFDEARYRSRTIVEKFEAYADVGFAVVLMTRDDRGGPKVASTDEYRPCARRNVLSEMGFFMGRLGRGHVCGLYEPGVEMPSDYSGVLYKPLELNGGWRWEPAREINAAGIEVDLKLFCSVF